MSEVEAVNVPVEIGMGITVGGTELVTLYKTDGTGIRVHPSDVESLLALGLTRDTFDRKLAKREALALVRALREAIDAFHIDGVDDEAELAAIHTAFELASNAVAYLSRGIERDLVPVESPTVTMLNKAGRPVQVDPAQVALYKTEHGHTEVSRA